MYTNPNDICYHIDDNHSMIEYNYAVLLDRNSSNGSYVPNTH